MRVEMYVRAPPTGADEEHRGTESDVCMQRTGGHKYKGESRQRCSCTKRRRSARTNGRKNTHEDGNDEQGSICTASDRGRAREEKTMKRVRAGQTAVSGWPMQRADAHRWLGAPLQTASARQGDCACTGLGGRLVSETSRRRPGGKLAPPGSP